MHITAYIILLVINILILRKLLISFRKNLKVHRNNKNYPNGFDCPACGNKMQLVIMRIFDKSKDICNICNYEEYSYILRRNK